MILALVHNPDVQRKCQEELDHVVGRSRVPTFDDLESLPYVRATVKECARWAPVTPVGMLFLLPKARDSADRNDLDKGSPIFPLKYVVTRRWWIYADAVS